MGQLIPGATALNDIFNLLPNSRAEITQRGDAGIVVNLGTIAAVGAVDAVAMSAYGGGGAITAGTIAAGTGTLVGQSGESARAAGVSITGNGYVSFFMRMEHKDAELYKNKTAAFQVAVAHDVGANINYTVTISKGSTPDNWTANTLIALSPAVSIPTAKGTILKFENIALGDCSNCIEIEVRAYCGIVVNKNFDFAEWALTLGSVAPVFVGKSSVNDLYQCSRYLYNYFLFRGLTPNNSFVGLAGSATTAYVTFQEKRDMFSSGKVLFSCPNSPNSFLNIMRTGISTFDLTITNNPPGSIQLQIDSPTALMNPGENVYVNIRGNNGIFRAYLFSAPELF